MARSLLKAALECAWLDHGEEVLGPPYDHIRTFVLGAARPGYLTLLKKGDPDDVSLRLTSWQRPRESGEVDLIVAVSYYGIFMATDSMNAEPQLPVPDDVAGTVTY